MCEYTCAKKRFDVKDVEEARLFFANGDYFTLTKKEIVDLDVVFYDELSVGEKGFCPVAQRGFLKCRPDASRRERGALLYPNSKYGKSQKEYLENRCVSEGGIRYVCLCNEDNWGLAFYCDTTVCLRDGLLMLEFQERRGHGGADGERHTVRARNLTKKNIRSIELDFENCETITVYQDEIEEIRLNLEKELTWTSDSFQRKLKNGCIRLRLDKDYSWGRATNFYAPMKSTVKTLERRICGKGRAEVDICHLYVTYDAVTHQEECIEIDDIRPIEEQDADEWGYVSGFAEKQKDGSILIVFGK